MKTYTTKAIESLVKQRSNPNGCPISMTYFTSLSYTNYSLVTEWYAAGNEIADVRQLSSDPPCTEGLTPVFASGPLSTR